MRVAKSWLARYYQQQQEDYARMYANPRNAYRKRRRMEAAAEFLRPWQVARTRVLEVGCGDGYFVSRVLAEPFWSSYVGIDLSLSKLEQFRARIGGSRALAADAETLPLAAESFDLVLCFETLEHLPDPGATLREIHRVLRPRGVLVLSTPYVSPLQLWGKRWLGRLLPFLASANGLHEHLQEFTARRLQRLLRGNGFEPRARKACVYDLSFGVSLFRYFPYGWYRWVDEWLGHVPVGMAGTGRLRISFGAEYIFLAAEKAPRSCFPFSAARSQSGEEEADRPAHGGTGSRVAEAAVPLRVLHVVAGISPLYGGTTQAVLEMCQSLRQAGLAAEIATTDEDGQGGNWDVPLGRPVSRDGTTVYYFHSPVLRRYGVSPGLAWWLRANLAGYHVVHIHGFFSYVTPPAAYFAWACGVPYIVRPSGELDAYSLQKHLGWKRAYLEAIGKPILKQAAAIHCTSELERAHVERLAAGARPVVIPLGVNGTRNRGLPRGRFRARHPWLGTRPLVLFLSRLAAKKGLDLLLPALAALRQNDFVLVIAGSGSPEEERQVRHWVEVSGLGGRTLWAGFVEGEEKAALLADADLFVLASRDENFGLAAGEALAAGLPVVISDQVSFHSDVVRARAGLVVPCQVEPLAQAIETLLDDAGLRRQMGERGRRLMRERYSWEQVTRELVALYAAVRASEPRQRDETPDILFV